WLGRADQTAKVKGMFVHPEQVAAVLARHPGIRRARLVLTNPDGVDHMTLHCEGVGEPQALAETLRELTKLRGEIVFVDGLPNDGKVIDDQRKFD
ncbi:MAG: phenylacetate--CoA ligase family protein, partial [Rhodocyclaceae bacterium]|nr:phenylacetate--CoA ligase family protein [Rhodocyclaceae bacterium]